VADERWGEMVVALVVLEEVHRPTPASIDTCARSRLAPHERPKIIFDVPELPLGPTGKLRRGAVAELAARLMQTNPRP
jgi:acyl-CoA synthetase (AMP-forming)/AMP-acid ligase II